MPHLPSIGEVDQVELTINRGSHLRFDVSYQTPAGVAIAVQSARAVVREGSGDPVLVMSSEGSPAYITILGNLMKVAVPPNITSGVPKLAIGRWAFECTTTAGEEIPLMEGPVRVRGGVVP